jgi:hypothetical protein
MTQSKNNKEDKPSHIFQLVMLKIDETGRRRIIWQSSVYAKYLDSRNDYTYTTRIECSANNKIYCAIVEREVFSLAEAILREKLEDLPYQDEYTLQRQYELENVEVVTFIEHLKEWIYKYHNVPYIPVDIRSSNSLNDCSKYFLLGTNKQIMYETIV